MTVLSAGKGESKYDIHILNKKIPKNILNKFLSKKNKVLIITDSGVPKQYLKNLETVSYTHLTLPTKRIV